MIVQRNHPPTAEERARWPEWRRTLDSAARINAATSSEDIVIDPNRIIIALNALEDAEVSAQEGRDEWGYQQQQIWSLQKALKKYGRHSVPCYLSMELCECGLGDFLIDDD